MGWTGQIATYYKNGKIDRKAECDAYFMEGLNRGHYEVLKSTMVGSTYYAAVKNLKKYVGKKDDKYIYEDLPENEQKVWAAVFLTSVDKTQFLYKDISEFEGPGYYECPLSILSLLSETDNEYALAWREKCKEGNHNRRFLHNCPVGTIITFMHNGKEIRIIKHPAGYQFKKDFWMLLGEHKYFAKQLIPSSYKSYLPIKLPVFGIVLDYKGLKEEKFLYTEKELEKRDPELLQKCKMNPNHYEDSTWGTANKTISGIMIENTYDLKKFFNNVVDDTKSKNEDWYSMNCIHDLYEKQEVMPTMKIMIMMKESNIL